jgi:hypothetical protein
MGFLLQMQQFQKERLVGALLTVSGDEKIIRREAVVREITQAELSVSRVIGLIAGEPQ